MCIHARSKRMHEVFTIMNGFELAVPRTYSAAARSDEQFPVFTGRYAPGVHFYCVPGIHLLLCYWCLFVMCSWYSFVILFLVFICNVFLVFICNVFLVLICNVFLVFFCDVFLVLICCCVPGIYLVLCSWYSFVLFPVFIWYCVP